MQPHIHDAIRLAHPEVVTVFGDDVNSITALDANGNVVNINPDAVSAQHAQLTADYAKSQYQRDRANEYPSLAEFADAYYWSQAGNTAPMITWLNSVSATKAKYPKPQE